MSHSQTQHTIDLGRFLLRSALTGALLFSSFGSTAFAATVWQEMDPAAKGAILEQLGKLTAADGAAFNSFGQTAAIDGDTIAFGAPGDTGDQGAVYVFVKPEDGWDDGMETAKLTASDGAGSDRFGQALAIFGDAVVVGAPGFGGSSGTVYVFVKPAGGWVDTTETAKLNASDQQAGDRFAWSVATTGEIVVVGAPDHGGNGAAYVFQKPAGGWVDADQTAKITASDGGGSDDFGSAVAGFEDSVAAAALNHDASQGAIYVFERPQSGWADADEDAKLTDSDGQPGDQLGWSLAMDGDLVVGGAALDDGAAVRQGSALVFERPVGGWADGTESAKLTASDGAESDNLGTSVDVSGDTVVAGAPAADVAAVFNQGAAYVFVQPAGGWEDATETVKIVTVGGVASDAFGYGIGLSDSTLAVGARSLGSATNIGSGYVFGPGTDCSLPPTFDGLETVKNPMGKGCGALRLDWEPGSSNCGGSLVYNVYRSTESDFTPGPGNLVASCVEGTDYLDSRAPAGQAVYFAVRAEDSTGSGSGSCVGGPEDGNQRRQLAYATDSVVELFDDDLESGTDGWETGNIGDVGDWQLVTSDSHSPTHSWFGADGIFCEKWLRFAEHLVISGNPAVLEFYHRFNTEPNFDGGVLEYSLENNLGWHDILDDSLVSLKDLQQPPEPPPDLPPVPPNPDRFLVGGYNSVISDSHPDGEFSGRQAWSGDSGPGFRQVRIDLSDFAGHAVNFRWRIRCDGATNFEGWYVDDVRVAFGNDCDAVFVDGFESGDPSAWSGVSGSLSP